MNIISGFFLFFSFLYREQLPEFLLIRGHRRRLLELFFEDYVRFVDFLGFWRHGGTFQMRLLNDLAVIEV